MKKFMTAVVMATAFSSFGVLADQGADASEMHREYMQSMIGMKESMHQGVMNEDPDIAFASGMLPHHVGAVDMARIELKYGRDPQMRKLAEQIIAAQDAEIAEMKAWLKQHSAQTP